MIFNENEFIHNQLLQFNMNLIKMVNSLFDDINKYYVKRNDFDEMRKILNCNGGENYGGTKKTNSNIN